MQKTMLIIVILALGFLALWVFRDKPPNEEATNAKAALESARAFEADDYAAETYQAAVETLIVADVLKEFQDSAFFFFRNYREAKALYIKTKSLAEQAQAEANIGKEHIKKQIPDLLAEARQLMSSASDELAKRLAMKHHDEEIDLGWVSDRAKFYMTKERLASAVVAYNAGEYAKAKTETEAVIEAFKTIKPQLSFHDEMKKVDRILDQIDTMKSK